MITFIHTADVHFGVENYGIIDHMTGLHSRLLDFKDAFNICIDDAINKNIDLFVFAGDAYKTSHPTPTHQKMLLEGFLKLNKAGIPVVIVIGNHDHPGNSAKAHALDLFHHLPSDGFYVFSKPSWTTITTKSGPIQIVGIPWPTRSALALDSHYIHKNHEDVGEVIANALRTVIKKYSQEIDPSIPSLLVGHLTVSNGVFSGSEKQALCGKDPILHPSDLAIFPFDYVALGHLHRHQNLNPNGYPAVVYSGSPERIDFGEVHDVKGYCLGKIPEKGKCVYEFITLPIRKFIQLDIRLNSTDDQTFQIIEALAKHNLKNAVIKIRYILPPEKNDTVIPHQIYMACREAWFFAGLHCMNPYRPRSTRTVLLPQQTIEESFINYCMQNEKSKEETLRYGELFKFYHQKAIEDNL